MGQDNELTPFIAADLSAGAYRDEPSYQPLSQWNKDEEYSSNPNLANSFTTYINNSTKQIVIAFKGTEFFHFFQGLSQLTSDLINKGGRAWESISSTFADMFSKIKSDFSEYSIITDGHSLGGGMAQTAALEYGLSGYGQDSLPISDLAIKNDVQITSKGGFGDAYKEWKSENTFNETNEEGDIATLLYQVLPVLSHHAMPHYITTNETTIPGPFALAELDSIEHGNIAEALISAKRAHAIGNIVSYYSVNANPIHNRNTDLVGKLLRSEVADIVQLTSAGLQNRAISTRIALVYKDPNKYDYAVRNNGKLSSYDDFSFSSGVLSLDTQIQQGGIVSSAGDVLAGVNQTFLFNDSDERLNILNSDNFHGQLSHFGLNDVIDLIGISNPISAVLTSKSILAVTEQNGKVINLSMSPAQSYNGYLFESDPDGSGGTDISIATVAASTSTPIVSEGAGSEQFTLTRDGDVSGSATVYVSTTDGSTVAGESANSGNISPFVYQPVTFVAGSSTAQVGVTVNDLGLYDGATHSYGIQVTGDQSKNNVLATSQFYIKDDDPNPITITPANPVIDETSGSEQIILTRAGNLSQAETVYVYSSVTGGPSGLLDGAQRLLAAPVTFAADSATTSIADPLGLFTESGNLTQNVGLKVTSDQQGQNVLGTGSFAVTQNEETFKYVGNNFTSNGLPSQTPFSPSSLDMSVTFQDLPENYTGQIGSIGGPEGGYEPIAWSAQSEGETQNQSSGITGDNFVFEFVNGQISNWGIKVSGYDLNLSSGGFDAYSGSTNSPGDYAINETNYTRGATPTLGVWTRTA